MGQMQQPEAPEAAPAAQDTQSANDQQDSGPEWEDWVYLSRNDLLDPDDHFQYLTDHRDPGYPDCVLPRRICIPESLCDGGFPYLQPCQCLLVPILIPPYGPFCSYARCLQCGNPVSSLQNLPTYCRWQWFLYKYLQCWNRQNFSGLPSVRFQRLDPWWERYASYKYRPARELAELEQADQTTKDEDDDDSVSISTDSDLVTR